MLMQKRAELFQFMQWSLCADAIMCNSEVPIDLQFKQ